MKNYILLIAMVVLSCSANYEVLAADLLIGESYVSSELPEVTYDSTTRNYLGKPTNKKCATGVYFYWTRISYFFGQLTFDGPEKFYLWTSPDKYCHFNDGYELKTSYLRSGSKIL